MRERRSGRKRQKGGLAASTLSDGPEDKALVGGNAFWAATDGDGRAAGTP